MGGKTFYSSIIYSAKQLYDYVFHTFDYINLCTMQTGQKKQPMVYMLHNDCFEKTDNE